MSLIINGVSSGTDALAAPKPYVERHYELPPHIAAAAQAEEERKSKRRAGLVGFGGAGATCDRFGAAFRASGVATHDEALDPGLLPDDSAQACVGWEMRARLDRHRKMRLALVTVFVTIAIAGIGMTVASSSAPATETAALPGSGSFRAALDPAADTLPGTIAAAGAMQAASVPPPASGLPGTASSPPQAAVATADPTAIAGAATTSPENTEIAAYPSFAAGGSTGVSGGSSTTSTWLNDHPVFGGSVGGYSGGAVTSTALLSAVAASTGTTAFPSSSTAGTGNLGSTIDNSTGGTPPTLASDPSITTTATAPTGISGIPALTTDGPGQASTTIGNGSSIAAGSPPTGNTSAVDPSEPAIPTPPSIFSVAPLGPLTIAELTVPAGPGSSQPPDLGIPASVVPPCCALTQVVTVSQSVDVPEPATFALLATGLAAGVLVRRRQRARAH